jgi:uncharacterized membrane protein
MAERHPNARLEAFCDGVFAIALTLLIIDIRIPASVEINNNTDFWFALAGIGPSIFAFVLSFIVILITWVNHHAIMNAVARPSASFIYGNAVLLLGVVFTPFPTKLLGDNLLTDHAAPAVVLYNADAAFMALGWIMLSGAALRGKLTKNEVTASAVRSGNRNGYFALLFYSILAGLAFWYPLTVAVVTTLSWIFWFVFGVRMVGKSMQED